MKFSLGDVAARQDAGSDVVDALLAAVAMTDAVRPDDVVVHLDRAVPRVVCTLAGAGVAERSRFDRALRMGLPVQFEVEVKKQATEEDQIVGVVIDALQEGRDDEAHALLEEQRERGDEARLKEAVAEEIRRRGLPIW